MNAMKQTLFTIVVSELVVFSALLFYFIPKNLDLITARKVQGSEPLIANVTISNKQVVVNNELSSHLKIPTIGVNAIIENVGLTPDGAMDIPKSQEEVGWFEPGARPGDIGSAVIAGHYGAKTSVFNNLHRLLKGDIIFVEDDKVKVISFVVRESRSYNLNADASIVFGSDDGKPHLNLITCEGIWDKATKTYSDRLVVFADLF